jgi:formate hydrogenlyase subunit 6/NADH:ubiquinone oxidoreductase subunit I
MTPMTSPALASGANVVLAAGDFPLLLDALKSRGYRLAGPTLSRGELIYGELSGVSDLPVGWTDIQEGGTFRLQPREDRALFGYGVGQHSFKQFLFPPRQQVWQARRQGSGFEVIPVLEEAVRFAFIGVRSCDLHALDVQDRVFLKGRYVDPGYRVRRENAFIVAVNCGGGSCGTCFCVSMGTGPKATFGFDLALTEVLENGAHYLVAEVGSDRGAQVLAEVPQRAAGAPELDAAARVVARTAQNMGRTLDTQEIKELLYRNYDHPRWDDVAARCLTCGNCTYVCPTCFCHTLEDGTDVTGSTAERRRRMDVCFTLDFSYIHGGSIRATPRSRYRQWLTHKLATWLDQFDCLGCIGCGRCITWCPVAIDITAEVRAIRETAASLKEKDHGDH